MTDGMLTLDRLDRNAPRSVTLRSQPLVLINACETAELSPLVYDGLVPYFLSKGARGVLGTECKAPVRFAIAWAQLFFDRLLQGATVGETVHALTRSFLTEHGNPLGLMYAVHCNADTRLDDVLWAGTSEDDHAEAHA